MNKEVFNLSDRKKFLIILSFLGVLGCLVDLVVYSDIVIYRYTNLLVISLIFAALALNYYGVTTTVRTFTLVLYSLIFNVLASRFMIIFLIENKELSTLRSILIISILLPISGFVLGKKHSLYIGALLLLFVFSIVFITNSVYIQQNIYLLTLLITGYTLGMHYLLRLLEEGAKNENQLLQKLQGKNNEITFLNTLAFELADFSSEKAVYPIMLKSVKQYTEAKFAVFCEYDEESSALIIKSIESDGILLNSVIKVAGEKVVNTASPLSNESYNHILDKKIEIVNSLTEATFGAIPESIDIAIRTVTGLNTFYGIAHIISGKLYGTTLLAFKKRQSVPSVELLNSYAQLVALTLRRNIAEKALIINENQLRCITNNISDVVFTTDLELNTKYVSPSIEKLTGETAEVYIKKKNEKKYPIESLRRIQKVYAIELEKENDINTNKYRTRIVEVELFRADGSIVNVSTHLSFIRDKKGKAIGIQGITRDITEQKKAQKALKESEKKLKTVIETIPDLLFHLDKSGNFINFYQTSKTQELFTQPQDTIGLSIHNVFDLNLANKFQHAINQTLESNFYEFEYEYFSNELNYFHARCAKLNENEVIIISSEISKLKKSEIQLIQYSEELKQNNADKDLFMQILAHDLKNPFHTLLGFSDLLLRNFRSFDNQKIESYLSIIKQTSVKTNELLDELLLWSKAQSGKLPYNPERINVQELVNDVVEQSVINAQNKNIRFNLEIPEDTFIEADSNMIKTVIRNLVSNAVKFSNVEGEILINSETNETNVLISISDNGIGISSEDQKKLWNYNKPHTTQGTDNEKGTGLGLLICKDFVEKHGGIIWVESEEGKGCNFKIKLPLN